MAAFISIKWKKADGQPVGIHSRFNKEYEQLYTAWWYDNTKNRTISQLSRRLDVLKGRADYALVNVTCADYSSLIRRVMRILNKGNLYGAMDNRQQ